MARPAVKKGKATFQTQGRLLQELGERLVAKSDVALLELVKNAYDADASVCRVDFNGKKIVVEDDGHGMTEAEFLEKWMYVATPDKQQRRESRLYKRPVTGSKGIGRFAVRFLGHKLKLETTANDEDTNSRTTLTVNFKWLEIDNAPRLHTVEIPYEIRPASKQQQTGTCLTITSSRESGPVELEKTTLTELLLLVDPYSGLETGGFDRSGTSALDPGFSISLPGEEKESDRELAREVLNRALATITIKHNAKRTVFSIQHRDGRKLLSRTLRRSSNIASGFHADIRYFPRRAGMFKDTAVDGRHAWTWVKDNRGVGVIDHGFRMKPYGFEDDDWLKLSWDSAHNRREWRTPIMDRWFPMPAEAASDAKLNPMLYLPNQHQMVGAVFVESSDKSADLTPSMDREGFVDNDAYKELFQLVRAGLEMLAYVDHKEQRRLEEERRQRETEALRADLKEAAAYIEDVPGLSQQDREAVAGRFVALSEELEEVEEYYQIAGHKLEMMGLLGVLAGFLTHEMGRVLNGLKRLETAVLDSYPGDGTVLSLVEKIKKSRREIGGYLGYSKLFIGQVQREDARPEEIDAGAALGLAKRQFSDFAEDRGIDVSVDAGSGVMTPKLLRPLYMGVIVNLLTNALKAAVGGPGADSESRVILKAWNEPKWHVLEVADTGVGIPQRLRKRIWDPLFTTTSRVDYTPLGSGMGLGLALVKRVVADVGGKIELVDPPPGFSTCFRVRFSRGRSG